MEQLTKLHIAALRKADRVVFAHKDGTSVIRAIKENKPTETEPFARDSEMEIPCGWKLTDYASDDARISYTAQQAGTFVAFEMLHSARYEPCWQTTTHLLREGDALTLLWIRDGFHTQNLGEANLHGDALDLGVTRGKAGKKDWLQFHVHHSTCPDNSARMIRVPYTSTRASETKDAA